MCYSSVLTYYRYFRDSTQQSRSHFFKWHDHLVVTTCAKLRPNLIISLKINMNTSSCGNIFRVTVPLWGESTGHQWIFLTKDFHCHLIHHFRIRRLYQFLSAPIFTRCTWSFVGNTIACTDPWNYITVGANIAYYLNWLAWLCPNGPS